MDKNNTISLPSFLRKTRNSILLKNKISVLGCDLHRIGRSRNWLLKAKFEQIQAIITFIEETDEPSWQWLSKRLKSHYQNLTHDQLLKIASTLNNVTVSALIRVTDCTLAQARQVIDELEGLD